MHPIFSDIFKKQFPALPWKSEERATQVPEPNEVFLDSEGLVQEPNDWTLQQEVIWESMKPILNPNSKATEIKGDWLADCPRSYVKESAEDY